METFLWAIALLVASYAVQTILAPKAVKPRPASLEEFDFPQFEEGTPEAVIFGDCWTQDWFVLWYGNYSTRAVKSDGGKK